MSEAPEERMVYRVNSPQVIAETVGGETIIVNLASGHYFNLQGTAVDVWSGVERHDPVGAIIRRLEQHYAPAGEPIDDAVTTFLAELEAAGLIVADGYTAAQLVGEAETKNGQRAPFVGPTFTRFTDMQDIILLDPVHEVEATGWPHPSPAS